MIYFFFKNKNKKQTKVFRSEHLERHVSEESWVAIII